MSKKKKINSIKKGKAGEREAAHEITRILGLAARRGQQHKGGPDAPDVVGVPGLHIEVKRVEKLNLVKAMVQSTLEAGIDEIPVVMHRKNNQPWFLTCHFSDVLTLVKCLIPCLNVEEIREAWQSGMVDRSTESCF